MTTYPTCWDLDSILPHPAKPEFRSVLDDYRQKLESLAKQSDALPAIQSQGAKEAWAKFIAGCLDIWEWSEELGSFAGCHAAGDAENKEFQRLEGVLGSLRPLRERIAVNIELGLQSATDAEVNAFIQSHADLKKVAFFLQEARRNAKLRLPRDQELLAADLDVDGLQGWSRLYDRLCGELRIEVMEKGKVIKKSPGQVSYDHPERAVRENRFHAANHAWNTIADTCADALNHISGSRLSRYRRLGIDHLEKPLQNNRMERSTLKTMWDAISARKSILLPYFETKAKLLGIEKMSWFDQMAPLPIGAGPAPELKYDAACKLVVDTFNRFSPEFGTFGETALRDGWCEVENRPGKRQGGFCTGFPRVKQTRIFMTFNNSVDSMSTLAHELGHAYHSHVLRNHPIVLQDYPMNLAETASTFAEAVLGEQQLSAADSTAVQLRLLDHMLSDAVAFMMNIHCRFLFEDRYHQERQKGELSTERFMELMEQAQREAYLDAFADDGWYPGFWISKLHFYISGWPFYNFPYTFGYMLSLGLYSMASSFGEEFPARYEQFLAATGSMRTEECVSSTLGVDLSKPDFWNRGLDVIAGRVARYTELAQEYL